MTHQSLTPTHHHSPPPTTTHNHSPVYAHPPLITTHHHSPPPTTTHPSMPGICSSPAAISLPLLSPISPAPRAPALTNPPSASSPREVVETRSAAINSSASSPREAVVTQAPQRARERRATRRLTGVSSTTSTRSPPTHARVTTSSAAARSPVVVAVISATETDRRDLSLALPRAAL
ncbi:unnamed protein product [Closterium sp. Naga37s-1]|nr:unnamed protein product [Closterium sp. Naga37s-1]